MQADYQYFNITEPVKNIGGKLYTTEEGIRVAFNVAISYNAGKNSLTVYTLPYLVKSYTENYKNASIEKDFNNQKALLYNRLIVNNTSSSSGNNRYGVCDLEGNEIIGTKYTNVEFVEATNEFFVTTEEGKVGIMTIEGETKVRPLYDEIKQIDKDLNLYLARNGNKKGVIEKNGKILIYLEYDQIGVNTSNFPNDDIKNPYLLFGNCIPVKQNEKWGLFDKTGKLILPIEYLSLGCITNEKTANNVLTIPDVEGIVVAKEVEKGKIYGIINAEAKELVPTLLSTVYSIISNGQIEYTMVYNENKYNVIEYIKQYVVNENS